MSYSPGPWSARADIGRIYSRDANGYPRCIASEVSNQNINLIASVPKLVAALESISANAAESPEWIRRVVQEALAEAGVV
jgi:hypothetical protein